MKVNLIDEAQNLIPCTVYRPDGLSSCCSWHRAHTLPPWVYLPALLYSRFHVVPPVIGLHATNDAKLPCVVSCFVSLTGYQTKKSGDVVDIMHYHITPKGNYGGKWAQAEKYYRDIMRDPDNINFVTVLREPRSHVIRYVLKYSGVYVRAVCMGQRQRQREHTGSRQDERQSQQQERRAACGEEQKRLRATDMHSHEILPQPFLCHENSVVRAHVTHSSKHTITHDYSYATK